MDTIDFREGPPLQIIPKGGGHQNTFGKKNGLEGNMVPIKHSKDLIHSMYLR